MQTEHRRMKKTLMILAAVAVVFSSCNKREEEKAVEAQVIPSTMREASPSNEFTWSSANNYSIVLNLSPSSNCNNPGPSNPVVMLLDKEYRTIASATSTNGNLVSDVSLPNLVGNTVFVYLPETGALQEVNLNKGANNVSITIPCLDANIPAPARRGFLNTKSTETCVSGCTREIKGAVSEITIEKGETVCLTGTLTGKLEFKGTGGTLRVCGTANLTEVKGNNGNSSTQRVFISESGKITGEKFELNYKDIKIENYGSITVNNFTLNQPCQFINFGTLSAGNYNLNNGTIVNNGTITATGDLQVNSAAITNNKTLDVKKDLRLNSGSAFVNACKTIVGGKFEINSTFENAGFISVKSGETVINGGGNAKVSNGSQIATKDFTWNGTVTSTGNTSVITVSASTTINGGSKLTGSLDLCDANGIEKEYNTFGSILQKCGASYIPLSECNTTGYGKPKVIDTDADGVADELDAFPTDKLRAYKNSYPYSGYAVNGYEDLWPSMGDYDFNDLVLKYKINYTLNANNEYVDAHIDVIISAIGAGAHNGFAMQFIQVGSGDQKFKRVETSLVKSVTGSRDVKYEGDNVIIMSNDVFNSTRTYYTNNGVGPSLAPDTLHADITFNGSGLKGAILADLFIFRSNERGFEIHLPDHPATGKVDKSRFGTYDDRTEGNRWFKTANNLPWAIEVIAPKENFKHPLEKVAISESYPLFLTWVGTNGKTATDWYLFPELKKVFLDY